MSRRYQSVERVECGSATEFVDSLALRGPYFREVPADFDWIFRGHGSTSYELLPSALRKGIRANLLRWGRASENVQRHIDRALHQALAEADLLLEFLRAVDRQGLPMPGDSLRWRAKLNVVRNDLEARIIAPAQSSTKPARWPADSFLSLMAVAQHYGIPTRLLDWSYSPMVAAYFAATDAIRNGQVKGESIVVWALHRPNLQISGPKYIYPDDDPFPFSVVAVPRGGNSNLHAQHGLFTAHIHHTIDADTCADQEPLDVYVERQTENRLSDVAPILFRFSVPHAEAGRILWLVAKEGITASTMFPGFAGAAEAVKERASWERPTFISGNE